jgi:hypothetical protein
LIVPRVDRRLLAVALVALGCVAACGPQVVTPTPPSGSRPGHEALGSIPRPGLATDLGTSGPGFDGAGDFLSFTSELSPDATMTAYAEKLLGAGFQDVGRVGAWQVFTDASLTLWVRVGAGGPPTSLIVRVTPTSQIADGSIGRPAISTDSDPDRPASSTGVGDSAPVISGRPATSAQRPDPPHASPRNGGVGSGGTSGGGTTTVATAGGSGTPDGAAGGTGTTGSGVGPATGTGSGAGGSGGIRP